MGFRWQGVEQINVNDNKVCGVTLHDGTVVESNIVLSNATPKVYYFAMFDDATLLQELLLIFIVGGSLAFVFQWITFFKI